MLFDLGNTLVSYYEPANFLPVLDDCIRSISHVLHGNGAAAGQNALLEKAKPLNRERDDLRVWPLHERLALIVEDEETSRDDSFMRQMVEAFLAPIFELGSIDPQALDVLSRLQELGYKTAIVSNTPWGSPADLWHQELDRHGLLDVVDAVVFCVDVGWRKPHRAPFEEALSSLGVPASRAVFVGDDPVWDVQGAKGVGIEPVLIHRAQKTSDDVPSIAKLLDLLGLLNSPGN